MQIYAWKSGEFSVRELELKAAALTAGTLCSAPRGLEEKDTHQDLFKERQGTQRLMQRLMQVLSATFFSALSGKNAFLLLIIYQTVLMSIDNAADKKQK